MARSATTEITSDLRLEAEQIISEMRRSVADDGVHWFDALSHAIRRWPLASEQIGERSYNYLVAGEAFDWLLLAERLADEITDLVPAEGLEALLFEERLPVETSEEQFKNLLGAKYKAHLNFVYGVRVEAALLAAVEDEVRKERYSTRVWENGRAEDESFQRIYNRGRDELLAEFRSTLPEPDGEWLTLSELSEFHYWLFQYRVRYCDPAKVASDTRKGLAMLQRMELARKSRP